MDKKIDLIIPVYKAHKTLFKLLCSIAQQEEVDKIKVTLVNDCCPEGSYKEIIKRFSDVLDIQEFQLPENGGPGVARQYGIDHTNCPYIMFADADDTLYGCFVFSNFLAMMENNAEEGVIFSSFLEKTLNKQYLHHIKDTTWIFGKIYRRSFLEKYNIRFTNQRSNEDTCFNRKIMFIYWNLNKEIPFWDGFTYAWHSTNNSITAINHGQYSYDQSTCGFVDGMIETFDWADKQGIDKITLEFEVMSAIFFLYITYCEVSSREEYFQEQNFEFIKKFYNKVWKRYGFEYQNDNFISMYEENMHAFIAENKFNTRIFMSQPNIMEFMEALENTPYNENDIYRIWDKIPQEIKDNNIKCGVVAKDYYEKVKK